MSTIELLTPEEVADRLKIKTRTVQEWLRTGRLAGLKLGKLWRIRQRDLEAFLGAPVTAGEVPTPSSSSQESLEERRAPVMAAVGALAHLPGGVDEFLQRKQEEIDLEEERWERRQQSRKQ